MLVPGCARAAAKRLAVVSFCRGGPAIKTSTSAPIVPRPIRPRGLINLPGSHIIKEKGAMFKEDRKSKGGSVQELKDAIKDRYGKIARGEAKFCCSSCGPTTTDHCLAVGYSAEDLRLVPEMAILG